MIVFTMVPQVALGFFAKQRDAFHWTKLHRGLGYFVLGTACWQMWLGMNLFEMDTRLVQCYYAWLISVGVGDLRDLTQEMQVAFHFGADSVSIFELKTHLTKKGFDVEDPNAKKARKSAAKTKASDGSAPHLSRRDVCLETKTP